MKNSIPKFRTNYPSVNGTRIFISITEKMRMIANNLWCEDTTFIMSITRHCDGGNGMMIEYADGSCGYC